MKKGFLILQIDGLSFEELKGAINEGRAPFLQSLLKNEEFKMEKMYCGFPPIKLQTGVLYGRYQDIPGLVWFDKRRGSFASLVEADELLRLERGWSKGILEKGVAIGTIFSGCSRKGFGSAARLNLSLLLDNFPKYEIVFYLTIAPFILLADFLVSALTKFELGVIFEGIFADRIFRRSTFNLARKEIEEGTPSLYINFAGHDRRFHGFGRESFFTKQVIKSIDKKLRKIYDLAKKSEIVDYDLFIISDHGQAESVSFRECFGRTLGRVIEKELGTEISGGDFMKEAIIERIEKSVNEIPWLRKIGWPFMNLAKRYYGKANSLDLPGKVILILHGDFAHLYFNDKKERLPYEEIERRYPGFLKSLVKHRGIKLLLVSSKKGVRVLGKKGEVLINQRERLKGEDPLADVFDREFVLNSLKGLIEMRNSGDVIIASSKMKGKVLNFSAEFSCHGGIEKSEQEIFIIRPSSLKRSFEGNKEPKRLYNFFKKYLKYI